MRQPDVFIVGSKPRAIFPEVEPAAIYAANGAIRRMQEYRGRARLVGVVSDQVFSAANPECVNAAAALAGTRVDELVLLRTIPDERIATWPREAGLEYDRMRQLSRWQVNRGTLATVGVLPALRRTISAYPPGQILRMAYWMLRIGQVKPVEISTGLIGLQLAREEVPDGRYHVIGVGIDPDDTHDHASSDLYGTDHIGQDKLYIRGLIRRSAMDRVNFTDPEIAAYIDRMASGR